MIKFVTAWIAALAAGLCLAGAATSANARSGYYPGCNCGPKAPSTYYKTVQPAKNVTRYHDVQVYRQVNQVHKILNITRIQPIIHIQDVTRVHHHTIVNTVNSYQSLTQTLPPISYVSRSVQHYYDCRCGR